MNDVLRLVDSPCVCGSDLFQVQERGPHLAAVCSTCGKFRKFVARAMVGADTRSLADRPDISVSQRGRVMERHGYRCVLCGKSADDGIRLVVAHIIDREKAVKAEMYDPVIDSERNLTCACESCNSGMRYSPPSMALMLRVMKLWEAADWDNWNG